MKSKSGWLFLIGVLLIVIGVVVSLAYENNVFVEVRFLDGDNIIKIVSIKEGETIYEPTVPIKDGYTFLYWKSEEKEYDFTSKVENDTVITAVWEKVNGGQIVNPDNPTTRTYTVTFDTNGGNVMGVNNVVEGDLVQRPTNPVKDGYVFVNWTLNGQVYNFESPVFSNITLVANWEKAQNNNTSSKTYTIQISQVDAFSTDVYLTVYENGIPITVKGISYTDGVKVVASFNGTKIAVNKNDVSGERNLIVTLKNGSKVTAAIK